MKHIFRLVS